MNHRLITPAIILASFGVALGLTGPHMGSGRAAATDEHAVVVGSPATRLQLTPQSPATLPPQATAPTPDVTEKAEPVPEDDTPVVVTPEAQAQESEGFLDARERAAERNSRSH